MTSGSYKSKVIGTVAMIIIAVASASTQCMPPPDTTMVAWYPFDEVYATTSADLASGNTGAQNNGPLGMANGAVGNFASFNGVNQYVQASSTLANNFGPASKVFACSNGGSACYGNFTIDTWINISATAPAGVMTILDKRIETPSGIPIGYHLFVYRNPGGAQQVLALQLADGTTFTNYTSSNLPTLYNPGWNHVAVTVVRGGPNPPKVTFYFNAVPSGINIPYAPKQLSSLANASPLRIGTRTAYTALTGWFQGGLDELEIYNRDLTAAEVTNIYNGKLNPTLNAWNISFGYAVSDYFLTNLSSLNDLYFVYWSQSTTDLLTTVDVEIGTSSFGDSYLPLQTFTINTNTFLGFNCLDFALYRAHTSLPSVRVGPEGYLTLSNACTTSGCSVSTPIYWDQSAETTPAYSNVGGGGTATCAHPNPICPVPNPIPPETFILR